MGKGKILCKVKLNKEKVETEVSEMEDQVNVCSELLFRRLRFGRVRSELFLRLLQIHGQHAGVKVHNALDGHPDSGQLLEVVEPFVKLDCPVSICIERLDHVLERDELHPRGGLLSRQLIQQSLELPAIDRPRPIDIDLVEDENAGGWLITVLLESCHRIFLLLDRL